MADSLKDRILRDQVRLAVQQLPVMQLASFVVALALAYSVRTVIAPQNIIIWLALVLMVVLSRAALYVRFHGARDEAFDGNRWKSVYVSLALFSGVIWGVSAFIIFPSQAPGRAIFFLLVIASLAASTAISHAAFKWGAAAWSAPAMSLYTARFFLVGGETAYTVGFLAAVFLITILYYSFKHHAFICASLALKYENLGLLEEVRRANEILKQASTMDALTSLANRYNFDEFLDREWRRAQRESKPLSLIMLDIDHFKAYNDTYGHQAGDDCLKKVSAVIARSARRPADLAARYGGEEFVLVLPETDLAGAVDLAEKLRREIEALDEPHAQSPTAARVTISVGVASVVPGRDDASSALLRSVDQALYAAKNSGRNRVHRATEAVRPAL